MAILPFFLLLGLSFNILLLAVLPYPVSSTLSYDYVTLNFTASPLQYIDNNGFFLKSIDGSFALAFSSNSGDITNFYLSIVHVSTLVIVWSANRNSPVGETDVLEFRSSDGNVVLHAGRTLVWETNTTNLRGTILQLQESGNLVLLTAVVQGTVLWQSFDHPSDTLLSGQKLQSGMRLISSVSSTNVSEGLYSLEMKAGDDLVLYADFPPLPQPYWTMRGDSNTVTENPGTSSYALIDNGILGVYGNGSSAPLYEITLDQSTTMLRHATLGADGNLQIYFLYGGWNLAFQAVSTSCNLPSFCGAYGICNNAQCNCPQSFQPVNSTDVSSGCLPPSTPPSCPNASSEGLQFLDMGSSITYFANQYLTPLTTGLASCQQLCLSNCSCATFFYYNETGSCYLSQQLEGSLLYDGKATHLAFAKIKSKNGVSAPGIQSNKGGGLSSSSGIAIAIGAVTLVIIAALCGGAYCCYKKRRGVESPQVPLEDEMFLDSIPGLPTRFSFKELQLATSEFSKKLGAGGFGSVYEGVLSGSRRIAVKQLETVGQGRKEFRAEVATIGSIHHVHLVQLIGFCAEGLHRLLVYEHMANGSLDKALFTDNEKGLVLDWKTRVNIALGTAKGLAYLHEDCRERIIHCDIKPENILLDDNFLPKVSDFGLAKLMNREMSQVFTTLRGTRGYLAPEWLTNFAISEKSDVYSFGMVLLEIISGRKNFDPAETSEKWYFPAYAYRQAEVGKVKELVDLRLHGVANDEQVSLALRVAFWCIQEDVALRPSMSKVVNMLEGNVKVSNTPSTPHFANRLQGRMIDAASDITGSDYKSADLLSATSLSGPR